MTTEDKQITVTMSTRTLRALSDVMRRIPPQDPTTDQFITEMVDWLDEVRQHHG